MLTLVKRPNSPFWVARGTVNGRRIERSTKQSRKADAQIELRAIEAELTADEIGADGLTFEQALALYLTANPDIPIRPALAKHFKGFLVSEINKAEMRRAANLLFPEASPATIARHLYTPIKAIINHAADEELCAPARLKGPKGGNKRTVFFLPSVADEMIKTLATHPHPHFAVLVDFLFSQGSRMGETLSMEWADVSLEHRFAILRHTKSGKERRVTLLPRTIAALSTIRPQKATGRVFLRSDGQEFRVGRGEGGQIRYQWGKAAEAIGMDPKVYSPHTCRHSWATWFYAQTRDVVRLRDEGGWDSAEWQRYTKLGTPELGADARRYGWNFELPGENRGRDRNYA